LTNNNVHQLSEQTRTIPIILLSGMAADERLFAPQLALFPNLRVQRWIEPYAHESIQQYAARVAKFVDPGRPCIVGGASFGGIVALEMAAHLPALACVLIGSVRSPSGIPLRWRWLKPIAWLGPDVLRRLASIVLWLGSRFLKTPLKRTLRRLAQPEFTFERWAMCAAVRWRPSAGVRRVRIFQIHGEADRVLPVKLTRAEVIVPGGSHALSLFNASAVNAFLADVVSSVSHGSG
jgi:pimeloyl-ACP methyl ester carboxylesterase